MKKLTQEELTIKRNALIDVIENDLDISMDLDTIDWLIWSGKREVKRLRKLKLKPLTTNEFALVISYIEALEALITDEKYIAMLKEANKLQDKINTKIDKIEKKLDDDNN
jgi:hypothetical protein